MIIPKKLKKGDEVRIIAPSQNATKLSSELVKIAENRLKNLGLKISYGKHIYENDLMGSSLIKVRLEDFHDAFNDKNVKAIIAVWGGFNSNQLLSYIDYKLIKKNPKIFCGYSDITALQNAIYAKTKLVTYSGPSFSSFGMQKGFDYTLKYFSDMLFTNNLITIKASEKWSDDKWWKDQNNRKFINGNYWILNEGAAKGKILGGNIATFRLLYGTKYFPCIKNSVLFIEDDAYTDCCDDVEFDRNLQALIHQKDFKYVKGIVIGRFQIKSDITFEKLKYIVKTKKELNNIPIIANVDFGHTFPIFTFPIGGYAKLEVFKNVKLLISDKKIKG